MPDLNLRDIEQSLLSGLKAEAATRGITLKQFCVELLQRSGHQLPVPVAELRQHIGRPGQPEPAPATDLQLQRGISTKPAPRCPKGHGALVWDDQTQTWICRMTRCNFTTTDEQVELARETADYNY